MKSSRHECQYILILLSKGPSCKLLSILKKKKKPFILLSSTLTYACTELEHHLEVWNERFEFEYYSTDLDNIQYLYGCLRIFWSVLNIIKASCGSVEFGRIHPIPQCWTLRNSFCSRNQFPPIPGIRVWMWVNLVICASRRKPEWVAVKAPAQPLPKDVCSNGVVTLGAIHQIHSNSSNFRIYCGFDYPMYICVWKFGYPV